MSISSFYLLQGADEQKAVRLQTDAGVLARELDFYSTDQAENLQAAR